VELEVHKYLSSFPYWSTNYRTHEGPTRAPRPSPPSVVVFTLTLLLSKSNEAMIAHITNFSYFPNNFTHMAMYLRRSQNVFVCAGL